MTPMDQLKDFYAHYPDLVSMVAGMTSVLALVTFYWMLYDWIVKRGKTMTRKRFVKALLADEFTDTLLCLHAEGKLTTKEVNGLHRKLARQMGWDDMQPRHLIRDADPPDVVKERIRSRLAGGTDKVKRIFFPDTKPAPSVADELSSVLKETFKRAG
jgi:hypothetical protein